MVTRFIRRDMRHPDVVSVFNLEWARLSYSGCPKFVPFADIWKR